MRNLPFILLIEPNHFSKFSRTDFLEWLTPSSLTFLKPYTSTLSVLLQMKTAAASFIGIDLFWPSAVDFWKLGFRPNRRIQSAFARGGYYTDEDGFEVNLWWSWYHSRSAVSTYFKSIPPSQTLDVAKLLSKTPLQLIGLGARDSLRLEAEMCLYGNDLDETTTPVEAGLTWVIGMLLRCVVCLPCFIGIFF